MIIYRHRRLDNNKVFYIGISKRKDRPNSKYNRNKHWSNLVNKHGFYSEVLHECKSWEEACELECLLISEYGRRDLGTGCLVNMTDGGDGAINLIKSKSHRDKIGLGNRGKTVSHESRLKISKSKNKEVGKFNLKGKLIDTFESTLEAERLTGVFNSNISLVCNNKRKTAGGYIWKYTNIC